MRGRKYLDIETSRVKITWFRLSRGRGILVMNNLVEILDHVKQKES